MAKYKRHGGITPSEDYRARDIEELYELHADREERAIVQEKPLPGERVVREVIVRREAPAHLQEEPIKPLKLMGGEVLGSIFDRVEFLRKRIEEINEALSVRDQMHREMVVDIDKDIKEKEEFANRAVEITEKRNLKLDVSVLRKEKRSENVQFWRDITELRTELRQLLEKYETESKIVNIFRQPVRNEI